ncbi:MAG: winged helix-turn-helix domain-containing protein [bacterium]
MTIAFVGILGRALGAGAFDVEIREGDSPHADGVQAARGSVRHAGKAVTQRQLVREVWGPAHERQTHSLRIDMKQLRNKIEATPARPR